MPQTRWPPSLGDYVLATRWSDGNPGDPWAIGFYHGRTNKGHHLVIDTDGTNFRPGGFDRVDKITEEVGRLIVENAGLIEKANQSVWFWRWHPDQLRELAQKMGEINGK